MRLQKQSDIPTSWKKFFGKKKTTVKIRNSNGVERFKVSWSDSELVSDPEKDIIVISSGSEYPCKKDIFEETYEEISHGEFRKREISTLYKIPEGISVSIETLEGKLSNVSFPDYVVVGKRGELYANTEKFVTENLELND